MSLDAFSSIVQQLYAAAANPALWTSALRAVEDLTGSAGSVLGFTPRDGKSTGFILSGRFTEEQCAIYARDYVPVCKRIAFGVRHPDIPIQYDALIMGEREMDRDPVYDWLSRECGLRYYLGTHLPDVGPYRLDTSIQRTPAQGHVQKRDIELYARIAPHMSQALTLSNIIGSLSAKWQLGLQVLQRLPHGLLVLDRSARVMFANKAAEDIIAAADGIGVAREQITTPRTNDMQRLRRLIGDALSGSGGGMLRLERPSGLRAYSVFLAPFLDGDAISFTERPAAVVAILDPERRTKLDPAILQALYGLSPKEAEIALLIAEGLDTRAISARHGTSFETVRQQLKSVFRKMDVSRQQDLVGALASIASTAP